MCFINGNDRQGSILLDVLLAGLLVALVVTPFINTLITNNRITAVTNEKLEALVLAQSYLEELLTINPKCLANQPFTKIPSHPEFELAVNIDRIQTGLYEIHLFIRRGDEPYDTLLELATLAPGCPKEWQ